MNASSPPPAYREQDDAGGLHGVLRGEHDPAVVHPAVKLGVWGPTDGEVPLKEVVLETERLGMSVCVRVCVSRLQRGDPPPAAGRGSVPWAP